MTRMARTQAWLDGSAIAASALCVAHCLLLPALLIALPTVAAVLTIPESFHLWAVAFALPTSAAALYFGRRKHHHRAPMMIAAIGLLLLVAGAMLLPGDQVDHDRIETVLTVPGALILSIAHALNWRALRHRRRTIRRY